MLYQLQSDWLQEYNLEDTLCILRELARNHTKKAGRFKDRINRLINDRDYSGLCGLELDYQYTDSPVHLLHARQALAFFQKLEPLDLGESKRSVAKTKFKATEEACAITNACFRKARSGEFCFSPDVNAILHGARRKIAACLGDVPRIEDLHMSFGPGANTSVKASRSSARWKLGADLACSAELASSVGTLLAEVPHWAMLHSPSPDLDPFPVTVEIHHGKVQFVPKNAKTYRTIVVEPLLNSFAQKGIGKFLREKMRQRFGVDLSDQTRNQKLAEQGSRSGLLATIDLSSASDTISSELVAELLPLDWYSFLARFRTGTVDLDGEAISLEKFSSMGNGFTFELETLIFHSLALTASEHWGHPTGWNSTYGDDIIVPSECSAGLCKVLSACGFTVNMVKSYSDGPFRESCGKDYFLGFDIRPFYVKQLLNGQTLFALHNFYMRRLEFKLAHEVVKRVHPSLRIYGPDNYGDGHLIGDYSLYRSAKARACQLEGGVFKTFTLRPKRVFRVCRGDYIFPTYSIYASGPSDDRRPSDPFVVRGSSGYKMLSIYTRQLGIFF